MLALAFLLGGLAMPRCADAQGPRVADTGRVFASWNAWRTAYDELVSAIDAFEALTEEPVDSADDLSRVMAARDRVYRKAAAVEGFLYLRLQLDGTDEEARSRQHLIDETDRRWWATGSPWLTRTFTELGRETIYGWLVEHDGLRPYEFFFRGFFDRADHPLPAGSGGLQALADAWRTQSDRLYQALAVAEAPRVQVTLESGEDLEIDPARYRTILGELPGPVDRRTVGRAWLEAIGMRSQTYAALLEGVVEHRKILADERGFDSPLSAALHSDAIPAAAVRNVIRAARGAAEPVRRYHRLRSSRLGIDEYGLVDRFVPLAAGAREVGFDRARRLIIESTAMLGPEIEELVREAFEEGWIDSVERPGKRANAGSTFVAGHPYVYLSYRGSLENVFQLVHEIGHAVHAVLAWESQPFATAHRSSLTSEAVASVFEGALLQRLARPSEDPEEAIRALDVSIQNALRLFFRPMLDADFELRVYESAGAITGPSLDELYEAVLTDYYGDAVSLTDWDVHGWQTTPHLFTSPLYLGRYGLSSAAANVLLARLTSTVPSEAAAARSDLLALLQAGASDHPLQLLARAGADLADSGTIEQLVARLDSLVAEMERIAEP